MKPIARFSLLMLTVLVACRLKVTAISPPLLVTEQPLVTMTRSSVTASTQTPTAIFTATPLTIAHEWIGSPVMVMMGEWPAYETGDGHLGSYEFYLNSPSFILYADGQLFVRSSRKTEAGRLVDYDLWTKKLEPKEMCQLLYKIEDMGFLEYDPSTYDYSPQDSDTKVIIQVNAWKMQYVELYGLNTWVHNPEWYAGFCTHCSPPNITPTLRAVYEFLFTYSIEGMEIYRPDRLALWIGRRGSPPSDGPRWPLETLRLSDFWEKPDVPLVLEDEEARAVDNILSSSISYEWVVEGSYDYALFYRPLFPYELPPTDLKTYNSIPSDHIAVQPTRIKCGPNN